MTALWIFIGSLIGSFITTCAMSLAVTAKRADKAMGIDDEK